MDVKRVSQKILKGQAVNFGNDEFPPLPSQIVSKQTKGKALERLLPSTANSMAQLMDLPDELLLQILDYLPALDLNNFQLKAVASLSLTSHRLHNVTMNHLYATYSSFFGTPYPFLRSLMSNSGAAGMVQQVDFQYGENVHGLRKKYFRTLPDRRDIKAGFKALELPDWKTWATDCNDDDCEQEMIYTAILMHTPNIKSLSIRAGRVPYQEPKWIDLFRQAVSKVPVGRMHQFRCLKTIRIETRPSVLRLRHLAPLFRLPCLRTISATCFIEPSKNLRKDPYPFRWPVTARSSSIEEIFLRNCLIDSQVLATVIDSLRELKRFEYAHVERVWKSDFVVDVGYSSWWWYASQGDWGRIAPLQYPVLAESLQAHRKSLETLVVIDDLPEWRVVNRIAPGKLGCLKALDKVSNLRITGQALTDLPTSPASQLAENLPSCVRNLCLDLKRRGVGHMSAIEHLAANHRSYLPALEEFLLSFSIDDYTIGHFEYDFSNIQSAFASSGVRLVINGNTSGFERYAPKSSDSVDTDSVESDTESEYEFEEVSSDTDRDESTNST